MPPEPFEATMPRSKVHVMSVLFADLVDYTATVEHLSPSVVATALGEYSAIAHRVADRYGGIIEKFIGDAVVIVWGSTSTNEQDAERAVRAGLELADAVGEWSAQRGWHGLRVGIATGLAVADESVDRLASGDVMNTASRIQSLAKSGQVLTDVTTMRRAAEAVEFAAGGTREVKGKSEELELYVAVAVTTGRGRTTRRDHLTAPLVGYGRESARIRDVFNSAAAGGRDRLLIVSGSAGTGKTRMGTELQHYADGVAQGVRWHWTRATSLDSASPYSVLASAVRARAGISTDDPATVVNERLRAHLEEFVPESSTRRWLAGRLGVLLGSVDQDATREDLYLAWTTWWAALASDGDVVVWVIDDAQLTDDPSLDFVVHLTSIASFPMLMVLLARPELLERKPQLLTRRGAQLVPLDGLSTEEMAQLVDSLVDDPGDDIRALLVRRASGLPLFAIETVRTMIDAGSIVESDGRRRLAGSAPDLGAVPTTLAAVVLSRVDLLDDAARELLRVGSVLGNNFTRRDVAALAHLGERVDGVLADLLARELLIRNRDRLDAQFGTYEFLHPLVRQAVYEMIPDDERVELHLAAAAHLARAAADNDVNRTAIVEHLSVARGIGEGTGEVVEATELADWLARTAARAHAIGAYREARRGFELAIATDGSSANVPDWHVNAAEDAVLEGDFDRAFEHSATVPADPVLAIRAAIARGEALLQTGRRHSSAGSLEPHLARIYDLEPELAVRLAAVYARALEKSRRDDELEHWAGRAILFAQETDSVQRRLEAYHAFSLATAARKYVVPTKLMNDEIIRVARREQLPLPLITALSNAGLRHHDEMEYGAAEENLREALELIERFDLRSQYRTAIDRLAHTLLASGKWDECLELIGPVFTGATEPDRYWRFSALEYRGFIRLARDEASDPADLEGFQPEADDEFVFDIGRAFIERAAGRSGLDILLARTVDSDEPWEVMFSVWANAVDWAIADGRFDEARSLVGLLEGIPLSERTRNDRFRVESRRAFLESWDPASTTDRDDLAATLERMYAVAVERRAVDWSVHAGGALAHVLDQLGRRERAAQIRTLTRAEAESIGATRLMRELRLG